MKRYLIPLLAMLALPASATAQKCVNDWRVGSIYAPVERVGARGVTELHGEPNPEGPHGLRVTSQTPFLPGPETLAAVEVHGWMDGHAVEWANSPYSFHERVGKMNIRNNLNGTQLEGSSLLRLGAEVFGPDWLWPEEGNGSEPEVLEVENLAPGSWNVTVQAEYHPNDRLLNEEGMVCHTEPVSVHGVSVG
jgi:hypothetical protein